MKQKTRHKTTVTDKLIEQAGDLASQGFNNIMIAQVLSISAGTLSRNTQLTQSLQLGRLELAKRITETVLDTLIDNPTMQQTLVKRLCLFNPVVEIVKPTTAKQALANLATATKQYADGLINESQLRTIEAVSNSYVKGHEVTDLEARIQKLEELQGGN